MPSFEMVSMLLSHREDGFARDLHIGRDCEIFVSGLLNRGTFPGRDRALDQRWMAADRRLVWKTDFDHMEACVALARPLAEVAREIGKSLNLGSKQERFPDVLWAAEVVAIVLAEERTSTALAIAPDLDFAKQILQRFGGGRFADGQGQLC